MNAGRLWYVTGLALLALALASGCSRARNDAQIAGEVQGKIYADGNVPTKGITVASSNGIVTLSGNVSSDAERLAAASDAAQVAGVKTVVNNRRSRRRQRRRSLRPNPSRSRNRH